jgi:endonuclease YncB( thermonuclease family)
VPGILVCLAIPAAAIEATDDPDHPIWTLRPTRIDRSRETRERLAPNRPTSTAHVILVQPPLMLRPDGTFRADGREVQLFGINLPDRQRLCETETGQPWACGIRAYAHLAALLTATPLTCTQVNPLGSTLASLRCLGAGMDIATRLVGEGWAEPSSDATEDLKQAASEAKSSQRGLWALRLPED